MVTEKQTYTKSTIIISMAHNPYIVYKEEGKHYILQKAFPNYKAAIEPEPADKVFGYSQVPAHNLYLNFEGVIGGSWIPGFKHIEDEIRNQLELMAVWFYNNVVLKNTATFKKYKIDYAQSTTQ